MTTFAFARAIIKRYRLRFALLVALIVGTGLLEGAGVTLFLPLIEQLVQSPVSSADKSSFWKNILDYFSMAWTLPVLLGCMLILFALKNLFLYQQRILSAKLSTDFGVHLRKKIIDTAFGADWKFFIDQKAGTLVNALETQTLHASNALRVLSMGFSECASLVIYAGIGFWLSWEAFVISVVAGGLCFWGLKNLIQGSKAVGIASVGLTSDSHSAVLEDLSGIKFLKGNHLEEHRKQNLFSFFDKIGSAEFKGLWYQAIAEALPDFLMAALVCALFYLAHVWFNVPGSNLMVLVVVLYRMNRRMLTLQHYRQRLHLYLPSYELCADLVTQAERNQESFGGRSFRKLLSAVELRDVHFGYTQRPVLQGVSMSIPSHAFTALVGKSGSGKTTVLDLILGLLRPQRGLVAVDGCPLEQFDLSQWRSKISYVSQEPFIINGTITQNIALGNAQATANEIMEAAVSAHADEFILEQTAGYETVIGDRGIKLSGGQRQRLALARALLRKPELLILDEATSALDNESQRRIQQAIEGLRGRVTTLVVAHRLTTIENADKIYLLDTGRMIASGTKNELIAHSRDFNQLYVAETGRG